MFEASKPIELPMDHASFLDRCWFSGVPEDANGFLCKSGLSQQAEARPAAPTNR